VEKVIVKYGTALPTLAKRLGDVNRAEALINAHFKAVEGRFHLGEALSLRLSPPNA
jgi:hypothetical protein